MSNVITPKFRASYAHVFIAQAVNNDDGSPKLDKNGNQVKEFSLQALFEPGADLSPLKAAAKAVATERWGDAIPKNLYLPFRTEKEDGSIPDALTPGGVFMNFKTRKAPGLINAARQDIIDPVDFYSGCYARASVKAFAYGGPGTKYKPGVSFELVNIQKLADGEPLGGVRVKAQDEFEAVEGAVAGASGGGSANALFD